MLTEDQKSDQSFERQIESLAGKMVDLRSEISKAIVGQSEVVEGVLIALLAGAHVLLEGVPGVGKTLLVRTLAQAVSLKYSRIQFTPDLMPADVIGTSVVQDDGDGKKVMDFQPGPIFTNLLLADEINRTTPKTQSALLEAMQEKQVTVGHTTHILDEPFFVMATQNPLEMEGTYPLPEAQLDRFLFKLRVPFPGRQELHDILDRTTRGAGVEVRHVLNGPQILEMRQVVRMVPLAPHVQDYVVKLVLGDPLGRPLEHARQQIHSLWQLSARRAGLDSGRKSARAAQRPLQREHRRHSRASETGPAPPHHPQLRGAGGRPRSRRSARRDRQRDEEKLKALSGEGVAAPSTDRQTPILLNW